MSRLSATILAGWLLLPAAAVAAQPAGAPAQTVPAVAAAPAAKAPDVQVRLTLQRTELRAGDTTHVTLWVLNPSGDTLEQVTAYVYRPPYLKLEERWCGGSPVGDSIWFATILPGQLARRTFCLRAAERVREGDATVGMVVRYQGEWADGQRARMVVAEQKVKVGLFGTETVAGVSLSLLALVVPGLILVLLLKAGKVWDPGTTERAIATVMFSLGLGWILGRLSGAEAGLVSSVEFFVLCLMGAAAGALAWLGRAGVSWLRARRAEREAREKEQREREEHARRVPASDDRPATLLRKLLEANPGALRPRTVLRSRAGDGEELVGSLAAEAGDDWVLAGYYSLRPGAPVPAALLADTAEAQLALAREAERGSVEIELMDAVQMGKGKAEGAAYDEFAWMPRSGWEREVQTLDGGDALVLKGPQTPVPAVSGRHGT